MEIKELKERISIDLPDESLTEILYHSSYQPQSALLRKRNRNYECWGTDIINAAYAIYVYKNCDVLQAGEISKYIHPIKKTVWKDIYEKYSLEEYVIKSVGEQEEEHPDIVSKLVTLIYLEIGFTKVYEFLNPFFRHNVVEIDYKTVLQEYAQSIKLTPEYNLESESGAAHEKHFVYKVRIGINTAIGEGPRKKAAEIDAAKNFIKVYKLPISKPKVYRSKTENNIIKLSESRKQELRNAVRLLEINPRYLRYSQLNEAFTHKSYVNDHRNLHLKSNECLSVVGSYVLTMLCDQFIYTHYNFDQIEIKDKIGELNRTENLSSIVPTGIVEYISKSKNLLEHTSGNAINKLKSDVLKSMISILWINYWETRKCEIRDFVIEYAFNIFERVNEFKSMDYITLLHKIVGKLSLSVEMNSTEMNRLDSGSGFIYYVTYHIGNEEWAVTSDGYGNTKKKAKNNAAKKVLLNMQSYITDNEVVKSIQGIV